MREDEEDLVADVGAKIDEAVQFIEKENIGETEFIEKVYINIDDDGDDDGASTLVGHMEYGEKEVEMEVDDSESEYEEREVEVQDEGGLRRKRTIRVIIRSRAFL
jgi:hypothetical protein